MFINNLHDKYKIRPVLTKSVIFREKQCSKLINILIEFIAGFFTVSILGEMELGGLPF